MAKNTAKNTANLMPAWKKGETGNPNGRPLGQKNYATLYREALLKLAKLNDKDPDEIELEMIAKGLTNARNGDYRFYKDVLDRLHGDNASKGVIVINFDGTFTSSSSTENKS